MVLMTRATRSSWRRPAGGFAKAKATRPDLILLDLIMPGMDGLEFLTLLRSDLAPPIPPAILCSGFELTEEEALRRGALMFVRKPVAPAETLRVRGARPAGRTRQCRDRRSGACELGSRPHAYAQDGRHFRRANPAGSRAEGGRSNGMAGGLLRPRDGGDISHGRRSPDRVRRCRRHLVHDRARPRGEVAPLPRNPGELLVAGACRRIGARVLLDRARTVWRASDFRRCAPAGP